MKNYSKGAKVWRVIYPALIFVFVNFIVLFVVIIADAIPRLMPLFYSDLEISNERAYNIIYESIAAVTMPAMAAYAVLAFIIFFLMFKKGKVALPENPQRFDVSVYTIFVLLGISSNVFFSLVIAATGLDKIFPTPQDLTELLLNPDSIVLTVLVTGILVPIVEELCFRGIIFKRARTYFGILPAVIVSSLMFGLSHGNMLQFIYSSALGCLLAMVYHRSGKIIAPILMHSGFNLFAVLSSYFGIGDLAAFFIFIISVILLPVLLYLIFVKLPFNSYIKLNNGEKAN